MKKLFLFLGLTFSLSFFAQNVRKEVEMQFRDYSSLIIAKKFEKALDLYANEDFLKIVPKEQMVEMMDQLFNSKEMEFKFYDPENVIVLDDPFVINGKNYLRVKYTQKIEIKFLSADVKPEDLLPGMKAEFGSENVKYNSLTGFFEINTVKDVLAASADMKQWKFTVLERKQYPLLIQFIPEQFLKDLK
ncbi:hypothetical protein [Chryseobacterium sp.]|uniref:hypothetical protein n=1 Tax=Chryseobacterium sp. TaxID=1871047 RepID=UPI0011CB26E0|nr:hypothetical protein [Chryseobacterium sp.]TXF79062.1 hypothetical protein FUA25_01335 [Chryseobacterium sp.]